MTFKHISLLASMVVFVLIVLWNNIILYDDNVSIDFRTYQYIWSNTEPSLVPVEFIFSFVGSQFSNLDFRLFFSIVNFFFLFLIAYQYSVFTLLIILTSPFTVLGFGNTVLSFAAGLAWLALIKKFPLLATFLSIALHKAGFFIAIFRKPLFVCLTGLLLYFGQAFIPRSIIDQLQTFDEPLSEIFIKLFVAILPLTYSFFSMKRLPRSLFLEIFAITFLILMLFLISSKLADRVAYVVFFFGLMRADTIFQQSKPSSCFVFSFFASILNISLIFFSGAYYHLPIYGDR